MKYRIAPLFCRPWTLNGMSPRLIESHYEHNYGAALNRLNSVTRELEALDGKTTPAQVTSRLSREQSTLLNSTLLHELYFASLGGDGRTLPDTIASALARDFGSVDRWRLEFTALAEALTGDAGWILLTYVQRDGRLINHSASDHAESIAGGIPILALDMYEHAYHIRVRSEHDRVHRCLHAEHSLGCSRDAVHRCHKSLAAAITRPAGIQGRAIHHA